MHVCACARMQERGKGSGKGEGQKEQREGQAGKHFHDISCSSMSAHSNVIFLWIEYDKGFDVRISFSDTQESGQFSSAVC